MENREAKQICLGSWYWWVWGGHKERVEEGEYGENIMNTCM
jgi:hypothetical protein